MTLYCVAFKNFNTGGEWIRISGWHESVRDAVKIAKSIADEPKLSNTAIGVFGSNNWPAVNPPRYLYNRNVLVELEGNRFSSALSGIVNARQSDWF